VWGIEGSVDIQWGTLNYTGEHWLANDTNTMRDEQAKHSDWLWEGH